MEVYSDFEKLLGCDNPIYDQKKFARDNVGKGQYDDMNIQYAWIGWNAKISDMIREERLKNDAI